MLESYNNHCGPHHHPHPGDDKILYAKTPYATYEDALEALRTRNLAPGQLAVVRYYLGDASNWPNACGMPTRALLGVGGSNPTTGFDVYVFEDNAANIIYTTVDGNAIKFSRIEDAIYYILDNLGNSGDINLSDYPTKQELNDAIARIEEQLSTKADASIVDASIKEITDKLENKVDASTVYTKEEVNKLIDGIPVVDETKFVKIDNFDASINQITNELNNKVDASYVENYFTTNVEKTVNQIITDKDIPGLVEEEIANQNIEQQVSDAVNKKLEKFEGVTTESLDEALQNNAYFKETVITPIETINKQIETIETQIKDLDADIDGGAEDPWF